MMRYPVFFITVSVVFGGVAVRNGGASLILLWPAVSFALVGSAYAGLGTRIFGKRSNGTLDPFCATVLFPYLIFPWLVWQAVRVGTREPAFHPLIDGIFIGRRLLTDEYPPGIESVVDLTCEFSESKHVREGRTYRSLPTLDASAPESAALEALIKEIIQLQRGVYIHCAEGHGRTATVAAALLLYIGEATSVNDAINFVLQRRPKARMNSAQRSMVESFAATLCEERITV
ncbi:MAG: dual specificity protein phosphatase family protein [Candidatus Latescibacterota bacterium]|nr:MAG: dual specificity protein phosphatase family protein [Candidatus Latescibacterota bacterium]